MPEPGTIELHSGDRVYIRNQGWQTVLSEVAHRLLLKDAAGDIHDYPPSAKWEREILLVHAIPLHAGHQVIVRTRLQGPGGPAGTELRGNILNRSEGHDCNALLEVVVQCTHGRREPKLLVGRVRAWQVVEVGNPAPLTEADAGDV